MPDPLLARLIGSLILALITGTAHPAPATMTVTAPQPVQFSASWTPLNRPGNEQDVVVIGADGRLLGGATSSAVSPAHHAAH